MKKDVRIYYEKIKNTGIWIERPFRRLYKAKGSYMGDEKNERTGRLKIHCDT